MQVQILAAKVQILAAEVQQFAAEELGQLLAFVGIPFRNLLDSSVWFVWRTEAQN